MMDFWPGLNVRISHETFTFHKILSAYGKRTLCCAQHRFLSAIQLARGWRLSVATYIYMCDCIHMYSYTHD